MLLDYDTLKSSMSQTTIFALVKDCLLSMGDFANEDASYLQEEVSKALQKIKSGKMFIEYGEHSETFTLVDRKKFTR